MNCSQKKRCMKNDAIKDISIECPGCERDEAELQIKGGIGQELVRGGMENSIVNAMIAAAPMNRIGSAFGNVHLLLAKIKKGLDPNNVSNPGRVVDMDAIEKAEVEAKS